MATKQLANLAVHKLTVQPLVGDLVLTWDSVAGWPTVGDFTLRLDHPSNGTFEFVKVTSVNVGALQTTVTRAQESTSASGGFIVGSTGANGLTAQMMADAFVRLDTALSQTLTGPLVVPTALGGSAAATSYGSMPLKAAESLLVGTAASISFTSIPSTFRSAHIDWYTKEDGATTTDNIYIQFNGDTAANYNDERLLGNGATAAASETLGTATPRIGSIPGANATAAFFAGGSIEVYHYAGTTGTKVAHGRNGLSGSNATGLTFTSVNTAVWRTTATAINRIDLKPATGNFIAGSYFALWLRP